MAAAAGGVHALWIDAKDQLLDLASEGTSWGAEGTPLAESALEFDAAPDVSGALHLAYVRPINASQFPAGIYYRVNTGAGWSSPSLVYSSEYFRSAKPGDVHPSITGDNAGRALVTWSDPHSGQSMYARTADSGTNWSAPQVITATAGPALQARVAAAPDGKWLLIWRDSGAGGCGFIQRQSTDGGETWGAPEKVLSDITRCSESWSFAQGSDGRLWITGRSVTPEEIASANAATIAAWDGAAWSKPTDLTLHYYDPVTARTVTLNCIAAAVAGSTMGGVGCDSNGDIWAARSAVDLKHLIEAVKPVA